MGVSKSGLRPALRSWISGEQWRERILTFDPSWFTVTMGTGIIVQLLNFFPWPAQWLKNLGYVFWILDIVIFTFFLVMGILRLILYPRMVLALFDDFTQTSYLGAIPIAFDTITTGLSIYYSTHLGARYVTEVFWWIGVALSVAVACVGVFVMYRHQGEHKLEEVTGVWFLSFIPLIVTAALASTLIPHLAGNNAATILFVSFLMWALGIGMSFVIVTIYFWRLMACSLPPRAAIVSSFVPVGPFGMGAFAITGLATDLAQFVAHSRFDFLDNYSPTPDDSSRAAVAQMITWIGVLTALALLGFASFFLIEAFASVFSKIPKSFNIGYWSFVFPCGVYANAFCRLSTTLRNDGIKGWAAACVVGTILLWLMCAVMTTYKGIWQGKIFTAPGLQGYVEQEHLEKMRNGSGASAAYTSGRKEEGGGQTGDRRIAADGTYQRSRTDRSNEDGV